VSFLPTQKTARSIFLLALALGTPVLLFSFYLYFSRWPVRWFTGISDWVAMLLSLTVFMALAWKMPLHRGALVASIICLTPLLGCFLFFYSLAFVGLFFHSFL
jgi:hypothetical protein